LTRLYCQLHNCGAWNRSEYGVGMCHNVPIVRCDTHCFNVIV